MHVAWLAAVGVALLAAAPAGAQREDSAVRIAREITRRVARFQNLRALHPHATWRTDPTAAWSVRTAGSCTEGLRAAGVPHVVWRPMRDPVPAPVLVTGPIGGVTFRKTRERAPLYVSCELAVRMTTLAAIVRRHGVRQVDVLSAYRREPPQSFHVMGLALDLSAFHRATDVLVVEHDWEISSDAETCSAPPPAGERGRALRAIACELEASRIFSTVITPNYNAGHRDHFHIDARPDDARLFTR